MDALKKAEEFSRELLGVNEMSTLLYSRTDLHNAFACPFCSLAALLCECICAAGWKLEMIYTQII